MSDDVDDGAETLYDRLGGEEAVAAVVDDFYDRVLADEWVNHHFEGTDMEDLHSHQRQFVAAAAGGPVDYDGRDMAAAHDGLDITDEEFDVVADHLATALATNGVAEADRETLMDEVAALRPAIVSD
ncbi:group I truncated hemoglobin [Haloarchaeobius sp. HRN-SO-5]|uniref:group I truncated hemoglobin n=1 Tax=Haloarchaeobius sp. HRN-SO-5 TaxID=3446118 RepID=UPI003EBFB40C